MPCLCSAADKACLYDPPVWFDPLQRAMAQPTNDAMVLLERMLELNPRKRISAIDAATVRLFTGGSLSLVYTWACL